MAFIGTIEDARSSLNRARQYLDSGEGINFVADELLSAQNSAVNAWLAATDQNPDGCLTNYDYMRLFYDNAPLKIVDEVRKLITGWVDLEYQLMSDPDDAVKVLPYEEWKALAYKYISNAEKMIVLIKKSLSQYNQE